ncbi:MAG: rod shape-determining protein, partial [Planctomycetota bacterium]|nr:rod shape-determining protein [Planctomycetota bacterium]
MKRNPQMRGADSPPGRKEVRPLPRALDSGTSRGERMVVSRLFGLFSTDMAIDLGTSTTRLCVRGRGLVSEEPTVLAVKKGTHEVLDDGRAIG